MSYELLLLSSPCRGYLAIQLIHLPCPDMAIRWRLWLGKFRLMVDTSILYDTHYACIASMHRKANRNHIRASNFIISMIDLLSTHQSSAPIRETTKPLIQGFIIKSLSKKLLKLTPKQDASIPCRLQLIPCKISLEGIVKGASWTS